MGEIAISVIIADRSYKLVIEEEQEPFFRQAVKVIEKRMRDYSVSYTYKDRQDLLAMVALEFVTSSIRTEQRYDEQQQEVTERLGKLDALLAENLTG